MLLLPTFKAAKHTILWLVVSCGCRGMHVLQHNPLLYVHANLHAQSSAWV